MSYLQVKKKKEIKIKIFYLRNGWPHFNFLNFYQIQKSVFPCSTGDVSNDVLHKLVHFPVSEENFVLQVSVFLTFLY